MFSSKNIFVIAEMANSHEGSLQHAKKIVKAAANSEANAIKFQKFTADELVEPHHENYKLYKKLEMNSNEWKELVKFTKQQNLKVFVDVFGVESAKTISKLDVDGYKIHSADLSNPYLLKFLANTNKPILLSTAGCIINEIDEALKTLLKVPKEIVLMHGFQGYPTELKDMNLFRILKLKERYDMPIGIMDHVAGDSEMAKIIPLLGITLGATVVEKHLTLDRSKKGSDYYSALNPAEFSDLVSLIHMTKRSFGNTDFSLSPNELTYRLAHKKNPISKQFIKKGTKLHDEMFEFKRTNQKAVSLYDFRGRISSKNIPKGVTLVKDMISRKPPKVAAVIACRVVSSRLFAKQMQLIDNKPILQHMLDQLKKSKLINEIVLAISEDPGNEIFVQYAREHKLKFVLGDDTDVLKRLVDGAKHVNAEVIFRITPENPYIYWEGIDTLIKKHIEGNFDFSDCYNVPLGSGYEVVNVEAFERAHKEGSKRHRSELCSLYIQENQKKFKVHHFMPPKELQRQELRLTVDTPEDLTVARLVYKSLGRNGKAIPLKKIIRFLDNNHEITKINSKTPLGASRIWIPDDPLRGNTRQRI